MRRCSSISASLIASPCLVVFLVVSATKELPAIPSPFCFFFFFSPPSRYAFRPPRDKSPFRVIGGSPPASTPKRKYPHLKTGRFFFSPHSVSPPGNCSFPLFENIPVSWLTGQGADFGSCASPYFFDVGLSPLPSLLLFLQFLHWCGLTLSLMLSLAIPSGFFSFLLIPFLAAAAFPRGAFSLVVVAWLVTSFPLNFFCSWR